MSASQDDSPGRVPPAQDGEPATEFSGDERRALEFVNQKIAGARSLDEALNLLFESTRRILPCDRLSVSFLDEDQERLVSYRTLADYQPLRLRDGFTGELAGSSLQRVIEDGIPRIIDNLEAYAADHPRSGSSRLLLAEGVRSSMTCPLAIDGRVVGVLFRSSRTPGRYNQRHVQLHQAMAERLSQAVEKTYRIEQLTRANRVYMEMLGFVSHELKSPLATMLMEGQLLTRGYAGPLTDAQKEKVDRIIRGGKRLNDLIRDYLDLARLEGGDLKVTFRSNVDIIAEVLTPAEELSQDLLQEKGMKLVHKFEGDDLKVECDPALLSIVLVNLLSNAAKYGTSGGQVVVSATRQAGRLILSVWNEGPGFRDRDQPLLFRRFSRLPTPELKQVRGTGVGLYASWRVARLHNGRISARSEYGKWAEFTVDLPVSQPFPEPSALPESAS